MNAFNTAMYLANLLYNTTFSDPTDFEEMGLIAYNMIGNKNTRLYRYITDVDPETLTISLPCNVDSIESITLPFEDWNYVDGSHLNGDVNSSFTELYIESRKAFTNPLYSHGKYVHYNLVGDTLYFELPHHHVCILYKGLVLDDDGLPELNDKEVMAIAAYVAYVSKFKEGIATNNSGLIQLAGMIKLDWNKFCDEARTPESISQNEMNEILDAKTSWNRKVHNKSYKPLM